MRRRACTFAAIIDVYVTCDITTKHHLMYYGVGMMKTPASGNLPLSLLHRNL